MICLYCKSAMLRLGVILGHWVYACISQTNTGGGKPSTCGATIAATAE